VFDYRVRFHKGTPASSVVVLDIPFKANNDINAACYRKALESILTTLDYSFSICIRGGSSPLMYGYQVDE
jgi:hypothetical protein